jgi:hypothetical protein
MHFHTISHEIFAKCNSQEAVNVTEILAALSQSASNGLAFAFSELKLVFAGLQQGNISHLNRVAQQVSSTISSTSKAGYEMASRKMDEHLPSVKQRVAEAVDQAKLLYKKHMSNATWINEAKKHLNTANNELKSLLSTHIQGQPMLKKLDDPVVIQLLAYVIIGAPLLLLFLPVLLWLATWFAPASKVSAFKTQPLLNESSSLKS